MRDRRAVRTSSFIPEDILAAYQEDCAEQVRRSYGDPAIADPDAERPARRTRRQRPARRSHSSKPARAARKGRHAAPALRATDRARPVVAAPPKRNRLTRRARMFIVAILALLVTALGVASAWWTHLAVAGADGGPWTVLMFSGGTAWVLGTAILLSYRLPPE